LKPIYFNVCELSNKTDEQAVASVEISKMIFYLKTAGYQLNQKLSSADEASKPSFESEGG